MHLMSPMDRLRETTALTFAIHMLQTLPFAVLKSSNVCLYINELSMSFLHYQLDPS